MEGQVIVTMKEPVSKRPARPPYLRVVAEDGRRVRRHGLHRMRRYPHFRINVPQSLVAVLWGLVGFTTAWLLWHVISWLVTGR